MDIKTKSVLRNEYLVFRKVYLTKKFPRNEHILWTGEQILNFLDILHFIYISTIDVGFL